MTTDGGEPKGLEEVLTDHGFHTKGMQACLSNVKQEMLLSSNPQPTVGFSQSDLNA